MRRTSTRRTTRASTRTRQAVRKPRSRVSTARRRARSRSAWQLPTRPSYALLTLGGLLIAWQLVFAGVFPSIRYLLPARTVGMTGVVLLLAGFAAMWLEAAGMRPGPKDAALSTRARAVRRTRPSSHEDLEPEG